MNWPSKRYSVWVEVYDDTGETLYEYRCSERYWTHKSAFMDSRARQSTFYALNSIKDTGRYHRYYVQKED